MQFESLSEKLKELAIASNYEYIKVKAERLLKIGLSEYIKNDVFTDELEVRFRNDDVLIGACKKITEYFGLTIETRFKGLTVSEFYDLMRLFHFQGTAQHMIKLEGQKVDEIIFEHLVTNQTMTLFNEPYKSSAI